MKEKMPLHSITSDQDMFFRLVIIRVSLSLCDLVFWISDQCSSLPVT